MAAKKKPAKARPKMAKDCACVDKVSEKLKEEGSELVLSFRRFGGDTGGDIRARPIVETQRIQGRRGKFSRLVASFCPFCGKPFPEDPK